MVIQQFNGTAPTLLDFCILPLTVASVATTDLQNPKELLAADELPELGPGPRAGVQSEAALNDKLQAIFAKSGLSAARQQLIRSIILLWHDHHEPAHVIAQDIENPDGSFIHGIVHRREPDYWNSKYWFRRVGKHSAFPLIAERARELLGKSKSDLTKQLIRAGDWDPMAMVDACEAAAKKGKGDPDYRVLQEVQKIETESLLEHFCH